MTPDHLHRTVVEGPIGVGKMMLTQRLADHLRASTLFETPAENAFIAHSCENPACHALSVQLRLLL